MIHGVVDAELVRVFNRLDRRPIVRTTRSPLDTYVGMFDIVHKLFADTGEGKGHCWAPGRFSLNVPEGRCPTSQGDDLVEVEVLFAVLMLAETTPATTTFVLQRSCRSSLS